MSNLYGIRAGALLGVLLAVAFSLTGCKDGESYRIGGRVSGLTAPGLTLSNRGATPLQVSAGATFFVFPDFLRKGSGYDITVVTQPAGLICTVTNGQGTIRGTVTDISVACDAETHSVGGSVTGLTTGGLILQNNGADDLVIPANASSFEFATPIVAGSSYQVTVLSQPTGLTCTVNNSSASNVNADINNVQVVCSTASVGVAGTVSGLTGAGLVLQNNGSDDLAVAANATSFQFASPIAYGGTYDVTILAQPAGQTCVVTNGSGTAQANVTNIAVACASIPTYTVTASAGPNGSISPSGSVTVNEGDNVGFVATAATDYTVVEWLLNGTPVQSGGSIYTLSNVTANATVQVTFGSTALTTSVSTLALSVNDTATHPALTGTPRTVTVTNSGVTTGATNVIVYSSGLPLGTTTVTTCGSTLAPGSSCFITVTPGAAATSSCNSGAPPRSAPVPGTLTIQADNAPDVSVDVFVLSHGCVYQGGYLFVVDDTTPATTGIGGKVATKDPQATAAAGVVWSSNGTGPGAVDYAAVGTSGAALCNDAYDGACNSTVILSHYSPAVTYPRPYFAAGLCATTIDGFSDWYLPAYCEAGCGIQSMIVLTTQGLYPSTGTAWTSSEFGPDPTAQARTIDLGNGSMNISNKSSQLGVVCVRAVTN